jgi:integrin alpha FG-GAP repeat containing protein 1
MLFSIFYFSFSLLIPASESLTFFNITNAVHLNDLVGDFSVGSVADINSDSWNDFLLVNRTVKGQDNLTMVLWDKGCKCFFVSSTISTSHSIESVSSFDFNGDGWVDALVIFKDSDGYRGNVHWGRGSGPSGTNVTSVPEVWQTLSLILDYNGDHLPDIMTIENGSQWILSVWLSLNGTQKFEKYEVHLDNQLWRVHSFNYVDINSDCLADVLLISEGIDGLYLLNVLLRDSETMEMRGVQVMELPLMGGLVYGKPVIMDMNADGIADVIILSCPSSSSCSNPQIHVLWQQYDPSYDIINCRSRHQWTLRWAAVTHSNISLNMDVTHITNHQPVIGDADLDGYPDILVVSHNGTDSNDQFAVVLINTPNGTANNTNIRRFTVDDGDRILPSVTSVKAAFFMDIWENGVLDIILVTRDSHGRSSLVAMQQQLSVDHVFLKAITLSGYCYDNCKSGPQKPLGSVLPGAVVIYQTNDRNNYRIINKGSCHQMTSTLDNPSLPYVILGLGATPNFIAQLVIGVSNNVSGSVWYRQWERLIPNSQIIMIPQPIWEPSQWSLRLYLTPSNMIYAVSGILLALCVGLIVIVLLLHIREKYQDSKEKKQAKLKYIFTPM